MTRDPQRLADYLAHILEGIKRIEEYVSDMDEVTFLGHKLVQDAVIRISRSLVRPVTTSKSAFLNSCQTIPSYRFRRPIKCATL